MKKKALIITYSRYKDHELVYPYYRLQADGFKVTVVADKKDERNRVYGCLGVNMPCDVLLKDFKNDTQFFFDNYDLLYIPGGTENTERLRMETIVLDFIKKWVDEGRPLISICHAAQVLISAKVVSGKKLSGYYSIKDDIINAGAEFVDAPFVVDGNIISSPHYDHMGPWMEESLNMYRRINGVA